jgi:hypothetical protein
MIAFARGDLRPIDPPAKPARFGNAAVAEDFKVLQVIPLGGLRGIEVEQDGLVLARPRQPQRRDRLALRGRIFPLGSLDLL